MADQTNRSYDLADLLANTQKGNSLAVPVGATVNTGTTPANTSPHYLGGEDEVDISDVVTSTAYGPPYYCTTSVVPAPNQIVCGFWRCS